MKQCGVITRGSGGVRMVTLATKQLDRYVAPEHKRLETEMQWEDVH